MPKQNLKMNPVVHFEMPAEDRARVAEFYTRVFGWETKQLGADMGNYLLVMTTESDKTGPKKPGAINGGFYQKTPDMSPCPSVVIKVDNLAQHIEKVKKAGGKILGEQMDIPNVGLFVSFADTEGNRVGLMQPYGQ